VITDVINLAIAGIGFIHAVTRLIVRKGFPTCMNAVMRKIWIRLNQIDVEGGIFPS
jgi:hypothetical protein